MAEINGSEEGMVLTHFIVSDDVERSRRFYTEVLGGKEVFGPVRDQYSRWRTASSSSMPAEAQLTTSPM